MPIMRSYPQFHCVLFVLAISGLARPSDLWADAPDWSGRGAYRILVEVPVRELSGRDLDVTVASFEVDFPKLIEQRKLSGQFDPSSLHVHRYDSKSGRAEPFRDRKFAGDPRDCPCRFDDALSPRSDLSRVGSAVDHPDGLVPSKNTPRKARLFNREPGSTRGHLVWTHTQTANHPTYYAIYFDLIDRNADLPVSPAPWIGDVDVLRRPEGQSLGGFAHFTMTTGDLNGDGLFDLVAGTEKGDVMWFPNRGTPEQPKFVGCHLPEDQHGPIDCGWYAAPFVYDWNADGLPDLLIGTRTNAIVWWQNVGTRTVPAWHHAGFIQVNGKRLAVPQSPVDEDDHGIFKVDYYNQPWVGDFNADGVPDIVTGGYTTGRIYLFAGTGRDANGIPMLETAVPLEADGLPIDTIWAAAPVIHDFDHDGLPDLVTGSWFWSGIHRSPNPGEDDFLYYFANVGTKTKPQFSRRPFLKSGAFPSGSIARPSAIDLNADGLIDLLVNDGSGNVYAMKNIGQTHAPNWQVQTSPLTIPWGFVTHQDVSVPTANLDGNPEPECLSGNQILTIRGGVYAPIIERRGIAQAQGQAIQHPGPGYGDPYYYTWLADWDGDGLTDLLWGTQQGHIYFHRKSPGNDPTAFEAGELLTLTDGEPLRVGPPVVKSAAEAKDFTVLQGSRILLATEDFDRDGLLDLMVSETYGNLWFFRRVEQNGKRTLETGVKLLKLPGRTESLIFDDWDHDGRPDLLLGGPPDKPVEVLLNQSTSGQPALAAPQAIPGLPYVFWGAKPRVVDWDGDGDTDILIQSEFFSFFAERSFLEYGYRIAKIKAGTEDQGIQIQNRD